MFETFKILSQFFNDGDADVVAEEKHIFIAQIEWGRMSNSARLAVFLGSVLCLNSLFV